MKKLSILLMFVAVAAFVFVGCKKYDDGPAFSLASKKGRVVNVWKIEKMIYEGNDVPLSGSGMENYTMEFTKDNKVIYTDNGIADPDQDTWEFGDKKETIITKPVSGSGADTIQITRLKSKEFWMKSMDGKSEYHLAAK